jgi:hypothetical protein
MFPCEVLKTENMPMKEILQTMIDHLLLQEKDKVPAEGDFPTEPLAGR